MSTPKVMTYAAAHRWEAEAKRRGVSTVARSSRGFMRAYQRAGSWGRLPKSWKRKRNAFVARHMAQVRQNGEQLWKNGKPSRRALALIMWAYMPPGRSVVRSNPGTDYTSGDVLKSLFAYEMEYHDPDWQDIIADGVAEFPRWRLITLDTQNLPPRSVLKWDLYYPDDDEQHMPDLMALRSYEPIIIYDGRVQDGNHRMSAAFHKGTKIKAWVPVDQARSMMATRSNPRKARSKSTVRQERLPQRVTSEKTSIQYKQGQVAKLFRLVGDKLGPLNLDIGAGRYTQVEDWVKALKQKIDFQRHDLFNLSDAHNRKVEEYVHRQGGANTVTCSNVLNVIPDKPVQEALIRFAAQAMKDDGVFYCAVHPGRASDRKLYPDGVETRQGWQWFKLANWYVPMIKKYFDNVKVVGGGDKGYIRATGPKV